MSNIAIKVEGLSKAYQLGDFGTGTLSRDIQRWWALSRGKEDPYLKIGELNDRTSKSVSDIVWSLKDIDFEVNEGDALGIIGRNGAGKSTLLKLLSRVTSPTKGSIKVKGRIASLLEVGTGFHPELTGEENIYLNGAIMGMNKREIKRKFEEIVDFAGVERYIGTPVKRYSSGMYVRLAFAVAAHLESEILIVDEVLAVGDAEFQKKCLGKMNDVSKGEGRTVLFVSHNMGSIKRLCNKGIVLDVGKIVLSGNVSEAIDRYQSLSSNSMLEVWYSGNDKDNGDENCIKKASLIFKEDAGNSRAEILLSIAGDSDLKPAFIAFDIKNSTGVVVMQAIPRVAPFIYFNGAVQEFKSEIFLHGLIPDTYTVSIWIGPHNTTTYEWLIDVLSFGIIESPTVGRTFPHSTFNGFFVPKSNIEKIK